MEKDTNPPETTRYPRTRLRLRKPVNRDIEALLTGLRRQAARGLHLGAGSLHLPDLINCDLHNPDADLQADAANLTMFKDGEIDLIESHHMIEHLSFTDTDVALAEWHRVLRSGGLLILTFPDLTAVSLKWLKSSLVYPLFPRPEKQDYIVKMFVGSQEHEGMYHKNAFDLRRMNRLLAKHGFRIEFTYCRYPNRPTPSRLVIARKSSR